MPATGGWNWGVRPPVTQSFDPGPPLPVGPPTGPGWRVDGIRYNQLAWPFCISDITGKIKSVSQGDFDSRTKVAFLKTLGMQDLIDRYPLNSIIPVEDAQALARMLGADGTEAQPVITFLNDPNTVARERISLVWDPDGEKRLMDAVNVLQIFRLNQPVYAVDQVRLAVMRSRTNLYSTYACDPVWFVNQVLIRAAEGG